jgi:hypothetical protein
MIEKLAIAEVVFSDGEFIRMIWDNLGESISEFMRNGNIANSVICIGVNPQKGVLYGGIRIGNFGPKRTFTNSKIRGSGFKIRFIGAGVRIWQTGHKRIACNEEGLIHFIVLNIYNSPFGWSWKNLNIFKKSKFRSIEKIGLNSTTIATKKHMPAVVCGNA